MRFLRLVILTVALLLVFVVAILLNDWFTRWNGAIGIISFASVVLTWVGNYYYFKNEAVYLFVQRCLLRARRTHSTWFFNVRYTKIASRSEDRACAQNDFDERVAGRLREITKKRVLIESSVQNRISLRIGDVLRLSLTYTREGEAALAVDKTLVPVNVYKEYLDELTRLFTELERELGAKEATYRMHIQFASANPYFGFFVRHIPRDLLHEFRCTFTPSANGASRIEVSNNRINIQTDNAVDLQSLATSYLSLSRTLITGATQ